MGQKAGNTVICSRFEASEGHRGFQNLKKRWVPYGDA